MCADCVAAVFQPDKQQPLSESGPAWGLRRTECLADWLNSGYLM